MGFDIIQFTGIMRKYHLNRCPGQTKLGLTIACHSAPEGDLLCDFPTPHPAWLVTALLIAVGVVIFALTVVFLAVSLKRNNRTFEKAAKWMALIGSECFFVFFYSVKNQELSLTITGFFDSSTCTCTRRVDEVLEDVCFCSVAT